mmetsp:Transcript_32833/g.72401  ORF Transcript_32833/g.72401 Transcript_32833/m.72401 type:complete len:111 (+) Transcript_32833:190-522(+)
MDEKTQRLVKLFDLIPYGSSTFFRAHVGGHRNKLGIVERSALRYGTGNDQDMSDEGPGGNLVGDRSADATSASGHHGEGGGRIVNGVASVRHVLESMGSNFCDARKQHYY